ncbi:MAG: hypothetical protein JST22_13770 [Bacteroidetes bacterium]|nr:hypothetical protein [Bacteroidota bacterium]
MSSLKWQPKPTPAASHSDESSVSSEPTDPAERQFAGENDSDSVTTLEQARDLVLRATCSPGNVQLLEQVRMNAHAIVTYLAEDDADIFEGIGPDSANMTWFGRVLDALKTTDPVIDESEIREILTATAENERAIGIACRDTLLDGLPDELLDFEQWFASIERINPSKKRHREVLSWLQQSASMEAFKDNPGYMEPLIMRGFTPTTLLRAIDAVAGIVSPIRRPKNAVRDLEFIRPFDRINVQAVGIETRLVVGEVALLAECTAGASQLLLDWMVSAAEHKPYMFNRCLATVRTVATNGTVRVGVQYTGKEVSNLHERWRTVSVPVPAEPVPLECDRRQIQ